MGDEYTTSPGQLRQFEENNGWLPSQPTTETTETNTSGVSGAQPPQQEVKPMTMRRFAQKVSFNKGDSFSHDYKVYYKAPDGKVSLVTGDAMGDVELNDEQTAQLEKDLAEKAAREKAEKDGPIYTDQEPDGKIEPNDPKYAFDETTGKSNPNSVPRITFEPLTPNEKEWVANIAGSALAAYKGTAAAAKETPHVPKMIGEGMLQGIGGFSSGYGLTRKALDIFDPHIKPKINP